MRTQTRKHLSSWGRERNRSRWMDGCMQIRTLPTYCKRKSWDEPEARQSLQLVRVSPVHGPLSSTNTHEAGSRRSRRLGSPVPGGPLHAPGSVRFSSTVELKKMAYLCGTSPRSKER
ncbi:hypothetical protein MPTK1_5g20540 [Marchantia polymorpha subsp. ruderalis]|uniref:Uncharacterized protein n=2 Tax=Marchantia polymorpha TaxID=3197 RepID=A0AAF6BKF5_MARPO|nr:hypothetical protein MARPO_0058s0032 [Marchantia polymorpha]BBN12489.1 hypothetical protein Mp_5g20540 [Marchantia polymorpha subsp. ruderalis]|eukprot:PTQ37242.1 hypothetical protein MARPO_0058s0032 [Marchantia polymorpha]